MTKKERWILSEFRVAKDRVSLGERVIAHREKTAFAELDLVTISRDYVTVFEVKSWNSRVFGQMWGRQVLTPRQLQRLKTACHSLLNKYRKPVRLKLAVVDYPSLRIAYFDPLV